MDLSVLKTPLQFCVEKLSSTETRFLEHVMRELDESSGSVSIKYRNYFSSNVHLSADDFQSNEYFNIEPVIRILRLLGWTVNDDSYGEFVVTID